MEVPYLTIFSDYGKIYHPMKLTGRWKIQSGPYYKNMVFIEYKVFIFKHWAREDSIEFRSEIKSAIFECEK